MSATVTDAVRFWARVKPDFAAIDFDGDVISYAELSSGVDGIACNLIERRVQPGDRVGLVGANTLEWCATALAAVKIGAIAAPLNNRMVARELAALVDDCEPQVVFGDEGLLPRLQEVRTIAPCCELATFESAVRPLRGQSTIPPPAHPAHMTDAAVIVFTSGSTGTPKGVVFTHNTIAGVIHEWSLMEPIAAADLRPLMVLPLFSAGGIIWGICRTLMHGGTLLLQPRFDEELSIPVDR